MDAQDLNALVDLSQMVCILWLFGICRRLTNKADR